MGILYTGGKGQTLKSILDELTNRPIDTIMCRCLWKDSDGQEQDDLFGYCSYNGEKLIPLDGDCYSLDDQYIKWEYREELNMLVVWEDGELKDWNEE